MTPLQRFAFQKAGNENLFFAGSIDMSQAAHYRCQPRDVMTSAQLKRRIMSSLRRPLEVSGGQCLAPATATR
jgi:hypothetical protein